MDKLRVLVGCEFSGIVRDEFRKLGHDAYSCDIIDAEPESQYHIKSNVLEIINDDWDLAIFHPPCTYLCSSGIHWNNRGRGWEETEKAVEFVKKLINAPIPKIAIENPIGILNTRIRKPDQIIQPWQFGHPESKATCLFLKNLPKLIPTNILDKPASGRWNNQTPTGQNKLGPSKDRWKRRSLTYKNIASSMADQWGKL